MKRPPRPPRPFPQLAETPWGTQQGWSTRGPSPNPSPGARSFPISGDAGGRGGRVALGSSDTAVRVSKRPCFRPALNATSMPDWRRFGASSRGRCEHLGILGPSAWAFRSLAERGFQKREEGTGRSLPRKWNLPESDVDSKSFDCRLGGCRSVAHEDPFDGPASDPVPAPQPLRSEPHRPSVAGK